MTTHADNVRNKLQVENNTRAIDAIAKAQQCSVDDLGRVLGMNNVDWTDIYVGDQIPRQWVSDRLTAARRWSPGFVADWLARSNAAIGGLREAFVNGYDRESLAHALAKHPTSVDSWASGHAAPRWSVVRQIERLAQIDVTPDGTPEMSNSVRAFAGRLGASMSAQSPKFDTVSEHESPKRVEVKVYLRTFVLAAIWLLIGFGVGVLVATQGKGVG